MCQLMEVALAGLLHDVGKLGQRAHGYLEGLGEAALRLQGVVCPSSEGGRPTHLHVLHTAEFVLAHARDNMPDGVDPERVLLLAAGHHRPDESVGTRLLAEADRLSAGMEREAVDDAPGDFRSTRLRALASRVGDAHSSAPVWVHELCALSPGGTFPAIEATRPADRTADYAELWHGLVAAWRRVALRDPWQFANRAMSVLERFTWCVPSATNMMPDISLFDHLKTTTAIACGLALARQAAGGAPSEEAPDLLLVSGEFGGIQDFVYDIRLGEGGLARRLRARSLYVWLATESAAHFVLRRLGLPLANAVLSAGGRFTLLLPNTHAAHEAVRAAETGLAAWSRDRTGAALQPRVACLPIHRTELADFADCLDRLAVLREKAKVRPLASLLVRDGAWTPESFALPRRDPEDDPLAASDVGRELVRSRFAAMLPEAHDGRALPFGSFRLVADEESIPRGCYAALDLDGGCGERAEAPVVGRFVARCVPLDAGGDVVEFTDLAAMARGRQALGYLKADVDNLGRIFSHGLRTGGGDRRSISRVATLSRFLEAFFAGYVQELARGHDVYLVYSGGDDLLAVGPWDRALDFAVRLRSEFRRFTCGNPAWSLSAGLVVVPAHTPSLSAAEHADSALDAAKGSPAEGVLPYPLPARARDAPAAKDRLVAFGSSLPWPTVETSRDWARALGDWLADRELSTGQVRRLLACARLYQEWQLTEDVMCFRYAPMLVYDINRNWREAPDQALQWAKELSLRDSREIPSLRFVCEYALYAARGASSEEELMMGRQLGDQFRRAGYSGGKGGAGGSDDTKCPKCGKRKSPEYDLCRECSQSGRAASGTPPGASARSSSGDLPQDVVFQSFYGANGKLRPEIFFEAAEAVAKAFRGAGYTSTAFRRLYQGFLGFAGPLRDRRLDFETAKERFGALYAEGIVRQQERGYLKPVVKEFVDKHRVLMLSSREEMLGFFRYLTNVLCYFGDKD